jgi:type IV pilus assembly protein PilA
MLELLRKRREDEDRGFTLIELMVVVLIIAILIAIAIPTFLGARKRAQDRAAQSNLRNALTAEKTVYTDSQTYADSTGSTLSDIEPSLTFTSGSMTGTRDVAVEVAANPDGTADQAVCLQATSASGDVFKVQDIATGSGAGTYFYDDSQTMTCGTAPSGTGYESW